LVELVAEPTVVAVGSDPCNDGGSGVAVDPGLPFGRLQQAPTQTGMLGDRCTSATRIIGISRGQRATVHVKLANQSEAFELFERTCGSSRRKSKPTEPIQSPTVFRDPR
jgi:hypothetical protein